VFLGYEQELEAVAEALTSEGAAAAPGVLLRVVAGKAGSGLSSFAVALAHRLYVAAAPPPSAGAGSSGGSPVPVGAGTPFKGGILCVQLPSGMGEGTGQVDAHALANMLGTSLGLVVMAGAADAVGRYLARLQHPLLVIVDAGQHVSPVSVLDTVADLTPPSARVVVVVVSAHTPHGSAPAAGAGAPVGARAKAGAGAGAGAGGKILVELRGLPPAAAGKLVAHLKPALREEYCQPLARVCGNLPAVIAQLCAWPLSALEDAAKGTVDPSASAFSLTGDAHVSVVASGLASMPSDAVRLLSVLCLHRGTFSSAAVRALHRAVFPDLDPADAPDHCVGLVHTLATYQYLTSSSVSAIADAVRRDGDGAQWLVPAAVRIAVFMAEPSSPGGDAAAKAGFVDFYGRILLTAAGCFRSKHVVSGLATFAQEDGNLRALMAIAGAGASQPTPVRWALARFAAAAGRCPGVVEARASLEERSQFYEGLAGAVEGLAPEAGEGTSGSTLAQAKAMCEFFKGVRA
jgi:hypothetical protein